MAEASQSHSSGEGTKNWVQIGGIIIAAVWAAYTFAHKEFIAPKSAPVNITLDLQLREIEGDAQTQGLSVVEVKCSAKNPSSRGIQLFPSVWIAYGSRVVPETADDPNFFEKATATLQDETTLRPVFRHAKREKLSLIAAGRLFEDTELRPSETTGRTFLIYVPKNVYHQLDFVAKMPTSEDPSGIQHTWFVKEDEILYQDMYRVDAKGQRIAPEFDEKGILLDKTLWVQEATHRAAISLGSSNEPPKF